MIKVKYTCYLEICDEIPNDQETEIVTASETSSNIISALMEGLSEKGRVTITKDTLERRRDGEVN